MIQFLRDGVDLAMAVIHFAAVYTGVIVWAWIARAFWIGITYKPKNRKPRQ